MFRCRAARPRAESLRPFAVVRDVVLEKASFLWRCRFCWVRAGNRWLWSFVYILVIFLFRWAGISLLVVASCYSTTPWAVEWAAWLWEQVLVFVFVIGWGQVCHKALRQVSKSWPKKEDRRCLPKTCEILGGQRKTPRRTAQGCCGFQEPFYCCFFLFMIVPERFCRLLCIV